MNALHSKRNPGIDCLRGLSILAVILLHLNTRVKFSDTFLGKAMPPMLYKLLFWSGYYGVCIFFVVSGFLITTSVFNKWGTLPKVGLREFYSMRFARIMPLLVLLLIILSVLHLSNVKNFVISSDQTSLARAVMAALGFHINWLEIKIGYLPASWDVLWSLSIEESFYVFFPLLCLLARKEGNVTLIMTVFLVISPFARTVWYPGNELADRNHIAYMDAIAMGCVAAIFCKRRAVSNRLTKILAAIGFGLMMLILFFRKIVFESGLTETGLNVSALALGTALVLCWMQQRSDVPIRYTRFLQFIGRNSYEVYLTHMFAVLLSVEIFIRFNLDGEWTWLLYAIAISGSAVLGEFMANYFTTPLNIFLREQLLDRELRTDKNL